jgi:hypothetical protein
MRALIALPLVFAALSQPSHLRGSWTGGLDTPHGNAPLRISAPAAPAPPTFDFEFMGANVSGQLTEVREGADSVSGTISFNTNMGALRFELRGKVRADSIVGQYVGRMEGQEMGRGEWRMARQR